jgi:hypothetical protein
MNDDSFIPLLVAGAALAAVGLASAAAVFLPDPVFFSTNDLFLFVESFIKINYYVNHNSNNNKYHDNNNNSIYLLNTII